MLQRLENNESARKYAASKDALTGARGFAGSPS
jgi:hypothetical protein